MPFASCSRLRELHLRQNKVKDLAEIKYLTRLPKLTVLSLIENPITQIPGYRQAVIRMIPNLQVLDNVQVGCTSYEPEPEDIPQCNTPKAEYQSSMVSSRRVVPPPEPKPPKQYHVQQPSFYSQPTRDDSGALTAVLALLPELSPDSISIVLEEISRLSK